MSDRKREGFDDFLTMFSPVVLDPDDVDPGLVLVVAVEQNQASVGQPVGQLDLGKADDVPAPVDAIVRRVGMNVAWVGRWWVRISSWRLKSKKNSGQPKPTNRSKDRSRYTSMGHRGANNASRSFPNGL